MDNLTKSILMSPWVTPKLDAYPSSIILKHAQMVSFKKGEIVHMETKPIKSFYYVVNGLLAEIMIDGWWNKAEIICSLVRSSSVSGHLHYVIKSHAPLRVQALQKTTLGIISHDEMRTHMRQNILEHELFYGYCTNGLRSITDALLVISSMSAEDRVKIFFISIIKSEDILSTNGYHQIPLNLTRETISQATYISIRTLDRIFGTWMREGVLVRDGGKYRIKSSAILTNYQWLAERSGTKDTN